MFTNILCELYFDIESYFCTDLPRHPYNLATRIKNQRDSPAQAIVLGQLRTEGHQELHQLQMPLLDRHVQHPSDKDKPTKRKVSFLFCGKNHRHFLQTLSMACIKWCIPCLVPLRSLALGEAPALQSSCRTASKPSVSDLTISNLFPNSLFERIF